MVGRGFVLDRTLVRDQCEAAGKQVLTVTTAMTEMAFLLIRFFQKFETIKDYGNKPVLKAEIVLTPGDGVRVGFGKSMDEKTRQASTA